MVTSLPTLDRCISVLYRCLSAHVPWHDLRFLPKPRELLWLFGMFIFLALMAEAFMGYLLPWGQMSFWGAQVIISLFGAIPVIGDDLTLWIRGDYVISGATLNRFFALHVIALPLVIVILVFLHIVALHEVVQQPRRC
ncbi:cytochrome b N-terminal domain-containing protein [Pseudoalteromonas lipolytica]|uniref:cytochrome b N-terminal domain-containing protein n=1 Tax=Pseudoalteromonas lipolytica TaxID=570156 RepID=UPI003A96C504